MNYKEFEKIKTDKNFKDVSSFKVVKAKDSNGYTITASTPDLDRDGEIILPSAFKASLPEYLSRNPVILFMHDMWRPPVARAVDGRIGKTFELDIEFASTDAAQEIKTLVDEGMLNTVSIGGLVKDWEYNEEGIKVIKELELWEVSIVTIPSNRSAVIQRMKAAGLKNIDNYFDDPNNGSKGSNPEVSDEPKRTNSQKSKLLRVADAHRRSR